MAARYIWIIKFLVLGEGYPAGWVRLTPTFPTKAAARRFALYILPFYEEHWDLVLQIRLQRTIQFARAPPPPLFEVLGYYPD